MREIKGIKENKNELQLRQLQNQRDHFYQPSGPETAVLGELWRSLQGPSQGRLDGRTTSITGRCDMITATRVLLNMLNVLSTEEGEPRLCSRQPTIKTTAVHFPNPGPAFNGPALCARATSFHAHNSGMGSSTISVPWVWTENLGVLVGKWLVKMLPFPFPPGTKAMPPGSRCALVRGVTPKLWGTRVSSTSPGLPGRFCPISKVKMDREVCTFWALWFGRPLAPNSVVWKPEVCK